MLCDLQDVLDSECRPRVVCSKCGRTFLGEETATWIKDNHRYRCKMKRRYLCVRSPISWRFLWLNSKDDGSRYQQTMLCDLDNTQIGTRCAPFFQELGLRQRKTCTYDQLVYMLNAISYDLVTEKRDMVIDLVVNILDKYDLHPPKGVVETTLEEAIIQERG